MALVTGASRGIGRAIAQRLAGLGARVLVTARSPEVEELGLPFLCGDLADDRFPAELIGRCRKEFGGLDILVNNAGVLQAGMLGMVSMEGLRQMFAVNVLGMINLTQYAVRLLRKSAGGSVINLASIAGTQGFEGLTGYSASKAAVVGFTVSAAKELAPLGIRVNAVAPGFIDTDMTRGIPAEWFTRRVEDIRLGRIGTPEDVAETVAFLAGDGSRYLTGQVLGVDGGMRT